MIKKFRELIVLARAHWILDVLKRTREPDEGHHSLTIDFRTSPKAIEWEAFGHPGRLGDRCDRLTKSSYDKTRADLHSAQTTPSVSQS